VSITDSLRFRIDAANRRYGPFSSTHEALGVASEEWDELREAIRSNDLGLIREEALDLAAVALRLAAECEEAITVADRGSDTDFGRRSRK
jgi:NTP pyrophosphatase (non-canonical NTP hydrolase)